MDNDTTTTTSSLARRSARRFRWLGPTLLASVALVLVASACNHADRKELGEEDARTTLQQRVEQAVTGRNLSLDGGLRCTAGIDDQGALSASCEGTTTSKQAVSATLAGTADVDAETCTAQLAVTVDGEQVATEPDVDCFHP